MKTLAKREFINNENVMNKVKKIKLVLLGLSTPIIISQNNHIKCFGCFTMLNPIEP